MTDITLWLRNTAKTMGLPHKDKLNEAADEIERLREVLEDIIDAVHCTRSSIGVAIIDIEPISSARKALEEK